MFVSFFIFFFFIFWFFYSCFSVSVERQSSYYFLCLTLFLRFCFFCFVLFYLVLTNSYCDFYIKMSIFLLNLLQTLIIILFYLSVQISFTFRFFWSYDSMSILLYQLTCIFFFSVLFFLFSLINSSLSVIYSFCSPSISLTHYF